ncbi:hypothetical protein V3N99_21725 [Dermatophilaceae bacterium Soc4.6]
MAYTAYTRDRTYWTLRTKGSWYLVLRLRSGSFEEVERYGWYRKAGAAATAVGALTYAVALNEATELIREGLQQRLDEMGLGAIPKPDRPAGNPPNDTEVGSSAADDGDV